MWQAISLPAGGKFFCGAGLSQGWKDSVCELSVAWALGCFIRNVFTLMRVASEPEVLEAREKVGYRKRHAKVVM